jgi:O-antigen ligase
MTLGSATFSIPTSTGIARTLLLAAVVSVLFSTSLSIVLEVFVYAAFACSPQLWRRLARTLRHPVMIGVYPFVLVLLVGAVHGPAPWSEVLLGLLAWRRLLLLPLCLAVFDDDRSKNLALIVFLAICLAGTLTSFVTAYLHVPLASKFPPGIAFHNYTVQSMALSLALGVCFVALVAPQYFSGNRLLRCAPLMAAMGVLFLIDIAFVLASRSGYVAVLVMAVLLVMPLTPGKWTIKAFAGAAIALCVGAILLSSAQVRARVTEAILEVETVDAAATGTHLGQRVVMWRNTMRMIGDHPIFGVGTGGFASGYRPYALQQQGWRAFETDDPHNQFLKIQGEQGILGLAAFLFFIFRLVTCPAATPYRQLAVGAVGAWCITSLANSHFSTFTEARLIFFWVGVMLGGASFAPHARSLSGAPDALHDVPSDDAGSRTGSADCGGAPTSTSSSPATNQNAR